MRCTLYFLTSLNAVSVAAYTVINHKAFMNKNVDALVVPGTYISHMHTFFGSDVITNVKPTTAELQKGCYSGENANDLSVYCRFNLWKSSPMPVADESQGSRHFITLRAISASKYRSSASVHTTKTAVTQK